MDRDRSSLFYVARALHQLQQRWGTLAHIKGKGDAAAAGGWVGGWVPACCLQARLLDCMHTCSLFAAAGAGRSKDCACMHLPCPAAACCSPAHHEPHAAGAGPRGARRRCRRLLARCLFECSLASLTSSSVGRF